MVVVRPFVVLLGSNNTQVCVYVVLKHTRPAVHLSVSGQCQVRSDFSSVDYVILRIILHRKQSSLVRRD